MKKINRFELLDPHPASSKSPRRPLPNKTAERGVALIITLLLLSMLMALSVGMVIALSSETLIGGYYRNARGAFYAADSGANVAIQYAQDQLVAGMPAVYATPPLTTAQATTLANTIVSGINSGYGSSTSLNAGNAANSWKETFKVTNATLSLNGAPTANSFNTTVCNAPGPPANGYLYKYLYSVTSVGSAQGGEQQTVTESGTINLEVDGQATTSCVSFSYFGAFIDYYQPGIGPLVPGTMTGPMFTNTNWEFMASIPPWTAPYIFTDPVGQHGSQVDYWDSGWGQHWSTATSYGSGANLVAPDFEKGLQLNQPSVPLPTNSFNQVEAVVDGLGNSSSPPWSTLNSQATSSATTYSQINAALTGQAVPIQTVTGQAYNGATTSGVFFTKGTTVSASSNTTPGSCPINTPAPCIAGGGFYVEGGADVEMIPVSGSSTAQKYIITQNGVTTTIVTDPAANSGIGTTTITQGSTTYPTLNGVPMNNLTAQPQTMVYVDGTVTVHGPGEGVPAIQDNAMISITANGDIVATADIIYKTEPVSIPQDTLIPAAANMNQVLGLYTANGNFVTNSHQPDYNIEVDGSIATIAAWESAGGNCNGKGGQLSDVHINTINNVGGMVQSCIYGADVNAENTWFDRRFTARPNFAPPWFPSTSVTQGGPLPVNVQPSVRRTQWLSTSAQ